MKKSMQKNKGFTLVELIVVLVILAILAAILVPALLGYIDRAKEQQIVLNARAVYTAAQAELSEMYAAASDTTSAPTLTADNQKRIAKTADVDKTAKCQIAVKGTSGHEAYTIGGMSYTEGGKTIYFDGKTWEATSLTGTSIGDEFTLTY